MTVIAGSGEVNAGVAFISRYETTIKDEAC
jgi:hypothetical protein